MRNVTVNRETEETKITIRLNLDGTGKVSVESGVPFFDHMLTAMAKHGGFDFTCTAKGDLITCPAILSFIILSLGIKFSSHSSLPEVDTPTFNKFTQSSVINC